MSSSSEKRYYFFYACLAIVAGIAVSVLKMVTVFESLRSDSACTASLWGIVAAAAVMLILVIKEQEAQDDERRLKLEP